MATNFLEGMPVGFMCHIFLAESQDLAEQVVMAMAQAFRAISESGMSETMSYASHGSFESRDSGVSKSSSLRSVSGDGVGDRWW